MPIERIFIVGAGGHARVVADALLTADPSVKDSLYFVDDRQDLQGGTLLGRPILGAIADHVRTGVVFHVAIGASQLRERLQGKFIACGARPLTIVHPRATVSSHAIVGAGSFIAAGAIIAALTRVGEGVVVNHAAVVDHDCEVGAWTHIGPHATLGGAVQVGSGVLVGANATVLPGKRIGARCTIGAGAVVVDDAAEDAVYFGVPARARDQGKVP